MDSVHFTPLPVWRVDVAVDEGDAHARLWLHAKHLQHKQVAMATT